MVCIGREFIERKASGWWHAHILAFYNREGNVMDGLENFNAFKLMYLNFLSTGKNYFLAGMSSPHF